MTELITATRAAELSEYYKSDVYILFNECVHQNAKKGRRQAYFQEPYDKINVLRELAYELGYAVIRYERLHPDSYSNYWALTITW